MKLFSGNDEYKLYHGNMLDMLEVIEPNSIDSIVTDPPYELNFMGKGWDNSGIAFQKETWQKCYEVLKPGGYLLAFGGSRTFHRIACAIEDAGFEIRDTIMWLYGSGFPKSMSLGKVCESKMITGSASIRDIKKLDGKKTEYESSIGKFETEQGYTKKNYTRTRTKTEVNYQTELGKKWKGWGTALKPSFEPIIVARKPFKGSLVDNVIEYGVGGINIDECRVGNEEIKYFPTNLTEAHGNKFGVGAYMPKDTTKEPILHSGRFPANTIIDETVANEMPVGSHTGHRSQKSIDNCINNRKERKGTTQCDTGGNIKSITEYTDSGSVSRYFYCAKASKKDRDEGLDGFKEKNTMCDRNPELASANMPQNRSGNLRKNTHPTVKPTILMQYLVRLVTPNGGTVLDPFNGSGSTGKAVMYENKERDKGYKYIGIELTDEYLPISKARIEYVCNLKEEQPKEKQLELFEGELR